MADDKFPRRVPALVTYLDPFRIVEEPGSENWSCSIEDINNQEWDYARLHEVVGGIDVELEPPYHLLVARDGALALPPIETLRSDQQAVEFFNRCLAALLLGGVFCHSITLDNLQFGSIIDWKYLRINSRSQSGSNQFHDRIRLRRASAYEAIALYKPRTITIAKLNDAMGAGLSALRNVPELSGEFLLKGVTGYARRDWGTALSNLWIVVEQLTQHLWKRDVLNPEKNDERVAGRKDQLADFRTWTTATRHELLTQKGIITVELLSKLSLARRARNDLAHNGIHPKEEAGEAALNSVKGLLSIILKEPDLPLFSLRLSDHLLSDPFQPIERTPLEPEFWMEIPKLPGERELEIEEAKMRAMQPKSP